MVRPGSLVAHTYTPMHLPTRRPALFLAGILVVAVSSCVVGDTGGGGTGGGAEPPNPVVLRPAKVAAGIDAHDTVLAGDTLVATLGRLPAGQWNRQSFHVSNGSVTIAEGTRVPHKGSYVSIEPTQSNATRVFYDGIASPITSVDIVSGEEIEYAGTEMHISVGVVGDALVTTNQDADPAKRAVFVSDLKAPQQGPTKIADGYGLLGQSYQLSGDTLSVTASDKTIDVYRVKSVHDIVKEGTLPADDMRILPEGIHSGGSGNVVVRRILPDGREKMIVYAKQGASFVERFSNPDSPGSNAVLAASGNLILLASWTGKPNEGPVTLSVADVSQQGASRELSRLELEDGDSPRASAWSGQVAYVYASGRVLAVDARDETAVKFVEIFAGVRGVSSIRASGSTVTLQIFPVFSRTLVLTMSEPASDGVVYCDVVDPNCLRLLRDAPNGFNNAFIYEPQYPLFSDGALKRRSLYLPPGQKIDTSNPDRWVFPKGTSILKEFYSAPATPGAAAEPLEARLWIKTGDAQGPGAWTPTVYAMAGGNWSPRDPANTQYLDVRGYKVPHVGVCVTCHQGTNDVVLGIDALQLSGGQRQVLVPDKPGATQPGATLERFNAVAFTQPVAATEIQGTAKAKAALGYLHSNCGSCHSDTGLAAGRTPRLRHVTTAKTPQQEPAYATLIAGGNVVPGSPATSNVFNRATTNMPPRFPATPQQTQDPAVGPALSAWILELAP